MSALKPLDFQEATANRILELYQQKQYRVLLADEVGLGKTIIASAVIQKVADLHAAWDDHFKVVYICSNINIANQNCRKLGIPEEDCLDFQESRLSMQHLRIYESAGRDHSYMQLIPMTPATSFSMTGGQGSKHERALIYAVLHRYPVFESYQDPLKQLLQYEHTLQWWDWNIDEYNKRIDECDVETGNYLSDMMDAISRYFKLEPAFLDEILDICKQPEVMELPHRRRREAVNGLRRMFASISLDRLKPDLVIMDEFQRFKDLIAGDNSESGMLARKFLIEDNDVKVLLLSATPYKPYSTLEELSETGEGHYQEFMQVMDFLMNDDQKKHQFHQVWSDYSRHLAEIKTEHYTVLVAEKTRAEDEMYRCVCRTERLSDAIFDRSKATEMTEITTEDIRSYTELQMLMDSLSLGKFPIEYVKSAPYLLSFMNYRVKDKIVDALEKQGDYRLVEQSTSMLLRRTRINRYEKIPCNNGRLQTLFNEAFSRERNGAELLLWIPASRPYYSTKSVFDKNKGYSKTLVFSSWEMVPRMIAGLTSYEAERLTVGRLGNREDAKQMRYFAQDSSEGDRKRRKVVVRLRDEMEEVLTYPCRTLAKLYEPLELADRSVDEVRRIVCGRVQELLQEFRQTHQLHAVRQSAAQVVALMQTLDGEEPSYELNGIAAGTEKLLTELAIGSPAICAYRLFKGASMAGTMAMDLADKFIALFNKQESMAIIDVLYGKKDSDEAYYWNVASYCVEGNLQAVLDEYAFTLGGGSDLELLRQMKSGFVDTASIQIETWESFLGHREKSRLRTHFAVGYFNAQVNEKTMQRTENIRSAFNSPFRPFVLATTSIGQEGLDFHNYCRKIMHWNLPSNPIDLEQREGRINRYLCHAIRQNLADSEFGAFPFEKSVWKETMDRATVALKQNHSDLIPYWCLPDDFPFKYKIERIVPMYPYSQDRCRYDHLMDVLSVYRLTLGQPRQEELFETIHKENWNMDELKKLYINLSPWNRAHHNGGTEHED